MDWRPDWTDDGDALAASLAERLDDLLFVDLPADEVAKLLVDEVVTWGRARGWRVYHRAPSVFPLPAPYAHQHSFVDAGIARADGPPIVVEVDHTDRRRTVDKLLAEAEAGRIPLWVRWGSRAGSTPPAPIRLVAVTVESKRGLHTRRRDVPVPSHSDVDLDDASQPDLF